MDSGAESDPLMQVPTDRTGAQRAPPWAQFRRTRPLRVQPTRICVGHAPMLRGKVLSGGPELLVFRHESWTVRHGPDGGEFILELPAGHVMQYCAVSESQEGYRKS